ncbi:MAG: bifunctional lysylphosphatidylglycerol flippase/synthetase MprF [Solirubrobacteraceae bacterium]
MGAQIRFLSIRQTAAASVAVLATQSVLYGLHEAAAPSHHRFAAPTSEGFPISRHGLALMLGAALLALTPGLWRGTRTAVSLTVAGLVALAALNAGHGRYGEAAVQAGLALLLALGRSAFTLGCSNRPRPVIAVAALGAWGLAVGAVLTAPDVRRTAGHVITGVLHHPAAHALSAASAPRVSGNWDALIEVLIAGAAAISVLAVRSLVRPAAASNGHLDHEYCAARAIVDAHGADSLSPFLLRPDKALAFAAGGVLAYRVIGGTAVISADPVAPGGAAAEVLATFQDQARRRGWQVVLWGAAATHLAAYRRLGLHAVRVGEEAFVDPRTFTLDGRSVRKLRQSVHRVARRGWEISVHDGRDIDAWMECEIELLSARWRDDHPRVHGFAMGMGSFTAELRPDDLYLLARSPAGELGAVMRFVTCGALLSLDTMQRVGDTPNGLNEALVARALEVARERGVAEVSLNYAGLAHLVRSEPSRNPVVRTLTRWALAPLHRRFQMDRLVRFNEKFSPEWRPRYLVYESRAALPRAIVRVLQAEGYLPHRRRGRLAEALREGVPRALPPRLRPPGPIGQMR